MSRKIYLLYTHSQEAIPKKMCYTKMRKENKTWNPGHKGLTQRSKENSQDDDDEWKSQNSSCAVGLVNNN